MSDNAKFYTTLVALVTVKLAGYYLIAKLAK